jgi:hypothetical protein
MVGGILAMLIAVVVLISGGRPQASDRHAVAHPTTAPTRHYAVTTTTDRERGLPALLPTAAARLRVLEIGDSLGIDFGDQLQSQLDATGIALTTMASLGDTGLANASYYDWPAHLVTLLGTYHPQVVVVFIGANDDQGLYVDGTAAAPGTPAWAAGYGQRVDAVVREATGAGARVVWVGMPPMANSDLNTAMQLENMICQHETETFSGTLYVSSASVLSDASGHYETDGVDASGQEVALRTPDGVHLTAAGAGLLARSVINAVDTRWHLSLEMTAAPGSTAAGQSVD